MFYLVIASWVEEGRKHVDVGLVWADGLGQVLQKASVLYHPYPITSLKFEPLTQELYDGVQHIAVAGGTSLLHFIGVEEDE